MHLCMYLFELCLWVSRVHLNHRPLNFRRQRSIADISVDRTFITGVREDSPKKLALSGFVILWSGFFKKEHFKTGKFILSKRVILRSRFFIVSQCHVGGRSLFWHHQRHHSLLPAEAICIYFHVARFLLERLACTCAYMCAGVFSVVCFSVLRLCCWLWSIFD